MITYKPLAKVNIIVNVASSSLYSATPQVEAVGYSVAKSAHVVRMYTQ